MALLAFAFPKDTNSIRKRKEPAHYRRKDSTACGRIVNAMSPALYAALSEGNPGRMASGLHKAENFITLWD